MYWDRSRIPREEEAADDSFAQEQTSGYIDEPEVAAPKWFAEAMAGSTVKEDVSEADSGPEESKESKQDGWSLTRLMALAAAAGGLYWAFTYDPISRFPKEQFSHPRLFGELDQAIGYGHQHAGRIVAATPYGVVMHGAKVPVSGGFAAPSGYSRGYSGSRGNGFAGLDDLDDLGGDGGDLIGDDFGGDGDEL